MIITISRQAASNGELIGHLVAERLGWPFYDRQLVEAVARRLDVGPGTVEAFDETGVGVVHSLLWELHASINENIYLRSLRRTLEQIARAGNAVVIGRGANFVLRGPETLHVRIIAPTALRVAIYQETHPVAEQVAIRHIRQQDQERANFVRSLFHQAIDDPIHYHLQLNLAGLTPEMAEELIVHAARLRAAGSVAEQPRATLAQHIEIMARHRRPFRPHIETSYQGKPE